MQIFQNKDSIGTVWKRLSIDKIYFEKPRWRWRRVLFGSYRIRERRLNPHISVVGESGSGKSNFCRLLICRLAEGGANIALLDAHNEYLGIADRISADVHDASYSGINIFELDGMSEKEKTNELTNMFKRIFRLGEVQGYVLYKCILYTYRVLQSRDRTPSISDLLYTMKVFKGNADSGERRILEALERRLALLDNGNGKGRTTEMGSVMRCNSIFLLSGLHTAEAQSVYIEGFLRKVYTRMLSRPKQNRPRFYVVIDEAEKLGQRSVVGKIAAEGRKYGVGVVAISQRAKGIDRDLRSNSSLFLSFYQREPEELNYLSNMISGGNEMSRFLEVKRAIRGLRIGSAVVLDSSIPDPLIVRFRLGDEGRPSLAYEIISRSRKGISRARLFSELAGLGFAYDETCNRIERMLGNGTIQAYSLEAGTGYDGVWYISMPRNSAEHDICVGIISSHLALRRVRNIVYNNSYGPDIIAFEKGMRIAYEYETGSKSILQTQHMLDQRARSYNRVHVIVNDAQHYRYTGITGATAAKLSDFLNDQGLLPATTQ